jgi:hypothetical protein
MSRYIVKTMYLEKPKQLRIWNGGSNFLAQNAASHPISNKMMKLPAHG